VPSRAELEQRVDELAAELEGREFAEAVRRYSEELDEREREELKAVLLLRARALEGAVSERFEAQGWFRRTLGRIGDVERATRERRERGR
jgi:hypothetical protein